MSTSIYPATSATTLQGSPNAVPPSTPAHQMVSNIVKADMAERKTINSLEQAYASLFEALGPFDLYGNYVMDPLLRSRREIVTQIFGMVDYRPNLELSVAALRVIYDMSESANFSPSSSFAPHKLFTILEESNQLDSVMKSYICRLEREEEERISLFEAETEEIDEGDGLFQFGLANIIRLQIIDFLIESVQKPGFNLAHYLLGFDPQKGVPGTVFNISNAKDNCLFVLLDILNYGAENDQAPTVLLDHPSFAEKCYQLVYVLLNNHSTRKPFSAVLHSERFKHITLNHLSYVPVSLINPEDFYFTAHELGAKVSLLQASCLDFFITGRKDFIEKLFQKDQSTILLIDLLKSLERIVQSSYYEAFSAAASGFFAARLYSFLEAIAKWSECLLYHKNVDKEIRERLSANMLAGVLHYLSGEFDISLPLREILASLLPLILKHSIKDSDRQTVKVLTDSITHPDSSLIFRSYMYASFSSLQPASLNEQRLLQGVDAAKLISVCVKDAISVGADSEAWRALACGFLIHFAVVEPHIVNIIASQGLLKPLIGSLRSDETTILSLLNSPHPSSNLLYLWKTKLSLFKAFCSISSTSMELLVDSGFLEQLSRISFIDSVIGMDTANDQLYQFVTPVLRMVQFIACTNASGSRHASIHKEIQNFVSAHFDLISHHLVLRGKFKPDSVNEIFFVSCDLINYIGPELSQLASRHGISLRHLFINMMIKSLLSLERDFALEKSTGPVKIIEEAVTFCVQETLKQQQFDEKMVLIDFDDLPSEKLTRTLSLILCKRDNLVELGKIPLGIVERLLVLLLRLVNHEELCLMSLGILERLLLIILTDLESKLSCMPRESSTMKTLKSNLSQTFFKHLNEFLNCQKVSKSYIETLSHLNV